jgi:phosphatidylserine/phosphatidylglycerophosphate/cardiolipin synthase-like enzyme
VNFQDLDLLVAGPAVEQANRIFDDYWNSETAIPVSALAFHTDAQLRLLVRRIGPRGAAGRGQPYLRAWPNRASGSAEPGAAALERCSAHRVRPADEAPRG